MLEILKRASESKSERENKFVRIQKNIKFSKNQRKKNYVRKGISTSGLVHVFVVVAVAFYDCCQFRDKLFVYESFGLWSILIKVLDAQTVAST